MKDNDAVMKEWRQEIISQIVQALTAKGLSQKQLAELLHTHRSNISRFESGFYNPSLDFVTKIARSLGKEVHISLR